MARFMLNTEVTLDHHMAHVDPIVDRTMGERYGPLSVFLSGGVTWLVFLVALAVAGHRAMQLAYEWIDWGDMFIGIGDWVLATVVLFLLVTLIRAKGRPMSLLKSSVNRLVSFDGVNVGPMKVVADEAGLTVEYAKRKTVYKWAAFEALGRSGEALALRMSKVMAVLLPLSAFKDEAEREAFEAFVRAKIAAADGGAPPA
ncbi:MAG: YcxB family protein [Pseudomonadota bacterium]